MNKRQMSNVERSMFNEQGNGNEKRDERWGYSVDTSLIVCDSALCT